MVIISPSTFLLIAAIVCIAVFARKRYLANTMRLLRFEGTVNIEDGRGVSKPVTGNIRFQSGDSLIPEQTELRLSVLMIQKLLHSRTIVELSSRK